VDQSRTALHFAVSLELPSIDITEVRARQKVTVVYEELHIHNDLISLGQIGHLTDQGARLTRQVAEVDT